MRWDYCSTWQSALVLSHDDGRSEFFIIPSGKSPESSSAVSHTRARIAKNGKNDRKSPSRSRHSYCVRRAWARAMPASCIFRRHKCLSRTVDA